MYDKVSKLAFDTRKSGCESVKALKFYITTAIIPLYFHLPK